MGADGTLAVSEDGRSWTRGDAGVSNDLWGVAYGDGTFVVAGNRGTILLSADARTWTRAEPFGMATALWEAAHNAGIFLVAGNTGTRLTSADGRVWRLVPSGVTATLRGLAFGAGVWVVVGNGGAVRITSGTVGRDEIDADVEAGEGQVDALSERAPHTKPPHLR